jgi:hypothetical protein
VRPRFTPVNPFLLAAIAAPLAWYALAGTVFFAAGGSR